jgi:hypothetical protein
MPCSFYSSEPQVCGDKQCPYTNLFVAAFTGYISNQCTAAPEECIDNDNGQCSGSPANPVKCGTSFDCLYDKFCLAQAAGCNVNTDCCLPASKKTLAAILLANPLRHPYHVELLLENSVHTATDVLQVCNSISSSLS